MRVSQLSLGEGNTPLIKSIKAELYLNQKLNLFFKMESANPTGTISDRGCAEFIESLKGSFVEGLTVYGDEELSVSAGVYSARAGRPVYLFFRGGSWGEACYYKIKKHDGIPVVVEGEHSEIKSILEEIEEGYPFIEIKYGSKFFYKGFLKFIDEIREEINGEFKLFIGCSDKDIEKIELLQEVCIQEKVELFACVETGSSYYKNSSIKNIVEIEKYESGEAGNVLKMEGIEYGKNEMLAFAAVQKRAESEEFFTEENIVIAVSREISSKQNESYIIEKIPGTLEGFKRVMGLK